MFLHQWTSPIYTQHECLEIRGVPVTSGEDTNVKKIGALIEVDINHTDTIKYDRYETDMIRVFLSNTCLTRLIWARLDMQDKTVLMWPEKVWCQTEHQGLKTFASESSFPINDRLKSGSWFGEQLTTSIYNIHVLCFVLSGFRRR